MEEITITSGRNMLHIDPNLTVWGWEIPVYLFLGGLVSGILVLSAYYYLRGKTEEMPTVVRITPLLAPVLLSVGLFTLFLDLEYKTHLFRFYTTLKIESPMSWGSWTLAVIFPLSVVWALMHIKPAFPSLRIPFKLLDKLIDICNRSGRLIAQLLIVFALLLGIYTGILLSAFNARPLWNSAILGPLFLVSGLSTGAALNLLLSKNKNEKHLLGRVDLIIIGVEVFLILHYFMSLFASAEVQIESAKMFFGGNFTAVFWVIVFGIGLLIPAFLEILEIRGKKVHASIPAVMILLGGLILRFVIVESGQISNWTY